MVDVHMSEEEEPDKKLDSEQNLPQKEDKTGKRENQKRRHQIMYLLLFYEAMSTSDLTEMCDLDTKGKDKYAHLWRPLKYLKDKGYIEKKIHTGAKDRFKGMGPVYSVVRNIRVLSAIYNDPEFADLHPQMREGDWVPEFILEERFDESKKIARQDILDMLRTSEVFFELCLKYGISNHLLLLLKPLFIEPKIISHYPGILDPELSEHYLRYIAVYDLFIYCMFKENLDRMIMHDFPKKTQEFMDKMLNKRARLKYEITNSQNSMVLSELLAGIVDASRKNNNQLPEPLLTKFSDYRDAVEKTTGDGFYNPRYRNKPREILMSIRGDLGISHEEGRHRIY
jgi:hypothetical protein